MESNTCTEQTQIEVGLFFPVESLYGYLEQIQDQRAARGVRYALTPILTLIVLAKMAEQSTLQAIAEWLHERRHAFQRLFRLQRRTMPHRTTLGRMLARAVPVEQLERVVSAFLAQLPRPEQTEYVLTLDGKTLRGTLDRSTGHQEHLLAAYLPHEGVVLVQVQVHQKQNEISAAPRSSRRLICAGQSSPAMHCWRNGRCLSRLSQPGATISGSSKAAGPPSACARRWRRCLPRPPARPVQVRFVPTFARRLQSRRGMDAKSDAR